MCRLRHPSGRSARSGRGLLLGVALVTVAALALLGAIDSLPVGALTMLPAVALVVVMIARPYLGEHVIARLRARRTRRTGVASVARSCRPSRRSVARGGRLIASALAGRAPPAVPVGRC